jgi:transposase
VTDFLQVHPDGVILALDEMSLYFQATLTRVWAPLGQTPVVAVHPQRKCVYFYGALNVCNGREIAIRADAENSELSCNFIMQLLLLYPQPILLLLDRASWHSGDVSGLIEQTERLQAIYFPVACPDLNPQEHVWERARDAISHNHSYRHFDTLVEAFECYLNHTPFQTNFLDKYIPKGWRHF